MVTSDAPQYLFDPNKTVAYCERCGKDTVHHLSIRLTSTADGNEVAPGNAKFAKRPVRRTVCSACETEILHDR
ncbi:DUF7835 family putative zinc beta-ribbon protein [Halegenticoccus soli]